MYLYKWFSKKDNYSTVAFLLLKELNVPVTMASLKKLLHEHPDYPSLLSISDVLNNYGVATLSLKIDINQLHQLTGPVLVQMEGSYGAPYFTLVRAINNNQIEVYDLPENKWRIQAEEDFTYKWSGIVLLAEAGTEAGEKDYKLHLQKEKRDDVLGIAALLVLPALTVAACATIIYANGSIGILPALFTFLTLLGTATGALLLWYGLDAYNPVIRQICSGGSKKVDCNAVLHSKAAQIAGVSWSEIGFTYFTGSLFFLLFSGIADPPALFLLSWLNVLALPYTVFSVYYQWHIVKQWCRMCLTVQVLLALQFVVACTGGWHSVPAGTITPGQVVAFLLSFLIPFLSIYFLQPALKNVKEAKIHQRSLIRLKHDPRVFYALLEKQKKIEHATDGLGILMGNPKARTQLIKVCNPYCGPCARAHPEIDLLLEQNNDLQVQVIFTASYSENDIIVKTVKHLLAVAQKGDQELLGQAMDDWYLTERKDYELFAQKYPMNGELKKQDDKIETMRDWCKKTHIAFTPTFFVNGYQLPDIYSVADLKYFLSV